jgi:predicted MFS family arabinose efflux permease
MRDNPWRLALGGMAALAAGMGVGRFVYTPMLPIMAEALHLTSAEAGLIASANFLGYLAGALLAAAPVLRGSQRFYLVGALAVNALTLVAMGLTTAFAAHLVLRFCGGLASAFILVFASALVLDRLAASGHDRLSAVHFAGVGGGIAISALAVAGLAAAGIGWQGQWLVSGLLGLIGLAFVITLLPGDAPHRPSADPGKAAPVPLALRAIIAAYGLFGFGYVITATFVVAMVRAAPQINTLEPTIWVLFGLSAVPSVALWMWIGARLGVLPAFAAACLIEAAGVAASVMWISAPGILIAVICLGGTFMGLTALGLIAARRLSAGDPRPNIALMTAAFGAGQVLGPAFAGLLFDRLGSFAVPSVAAAVALVLAAGLASLASIASARQVAAAAAFDGHPPN